MRTEDIPMSVKPKMLSWADFPPDFTVWKLNPTGCTLSTRELAPGVYAILSSIPGVNNAGFVVGEKGVLVIDAHISIPMARQILERVREVTDKPIRFLVNLNYHADHTFGNCAFPAETRVIQQRETAARTPYLSEEREFMLPAVANDSTIFEGVALRLPDVVFDDYLRIDLGGRLVELHWFGPANTPGDTIVYVPGARAAWTGNMTGGSFGLALESDAPAFLGTLSSLHPDDRTGDTDPGSRSHPGTGGPLGIHALLQPAHQRHQEGSDRGLDAGGDPRSNAHG